MSTLVESISLASVLVAVCASLACVLVKRHDQMIVWTWVSAMAFGAYFLNLKLELLAVVLWLVACVVGLVLLFFASLFGEAEGRESPLYKRQWIRIFVLGLVVSGYLLVLRFGFQDNFLGSKVSQIEEASLIGFGTTLVVDHWLSLIILGILMLLVIVGTSVKDQPQREE